MTLKKKFDDLLDLAYVRGEVVPHTSDNVVLRS